MIRNRKDLAHDNYSWCYGTDNFLIAFATYRNWVKELNPHSWFGYYSVESREECKVRHLTIFGLNIGYRVNYP